LQPEIDNGETTAQSLAFSKKATFQTSGKVNHHNVHMCGTENHAILEHQTDSPKVKVYCAMSRSHIYSPFIFTEDTVNEINYLDML
jgi:hypothetical protein